MAVFYSNSPWDSQSLDFNQIMRTLTGTTHYGSGNINGFFIGSSLSVVEGFSVALPNFPFENALLLDWADSRQAQIGGDNFTYSGTGALTGGTVTFVFGIDDVGGDLFGLADIAVSATQVWSVLQTASNIDDIALMNSVFSGDDAIALSGYNDVFFSGNGIDLVSGLSGNDRLTAGNDDDWVDGGSGFDLLAGGSGQDFLAGGNDNDTLRGDSGRDILFGGQGRDRLTGGAHADYFMAEHLGGIDVITDFGNGNDRIVFTSWRGNSFANLIITQDGDDAIVNYPEGKLRLLGVDASSLTRADFMFNVDNAFAAQGSLFESQWDYWDMTS